MVGMVSLRVSYLLKKQVSLAFMPVLSCIITANRSRFTWFHLNVLHTDWIYWILSPPGLPEGPSFSAPFYFAPKSFFLWRVIWAICFIVIKHFSLTGLEITWLKNKDAQKPDDVDDDDDDVVVVDDDDAFAVTSLWSLVCMENEVQMIDPMLLHSGHDKTRWGCQTVSVNRGETPFQSVNGSS